MSRQTLSGKLDAAELRDYANDEMGRSQVFMNSPRYFLSLLATYIAGMNFLARGNFPAVLLGGKNVGNELLAAAKDPPRSTEQVLHPEKYWDAAARDEPVLVNDDDLEKLLAGPGRFVVHHDTLGELLVALLTQPRDFKPGELALALPTGWTNTAAKGWAGDRFHLLAAGKNSRDAGKTLAEPRGVWITLWDTPQDRDEFLKACADSGVLDGRPHKPLGNLGEVIFFGFTDAQVAEIAGRLEKSPPRMTRDGKTWSPWAS
jgi:hypothetical protein